jgi:hypothetical protein
LVRDSPALIAEEKSGENGGRSGLRHLREWCDEILQSSAKNTVNH